MTRRVRSIEMHDSAEYCGHWYIDEDTEPRTVDAFLLTETQYYDVHRLDAYGEQLLCLTSPPELGIEYWCTGHHEWEDSESRRACQRNFERVPLQLWPCSSPSGVHIFEDCGCHAEACQRKFCV